MNGAGGHPRATGLTASVAMIIIPPHALLLFLARDVGRPFGAGAGAGDLADAGLPHGPRGCPVTCRYMSLRRCGSLVKDHGHMVGAIGPGVAFDIALNMLQILQRLDRQPV